MARSNGSAPRSAPVALQERVGGGSGARQAMFASVSALLLSTGWVANHFVALMPLLSDRQHLSTARLDAIFGIYPLGLLPGLLVGGRASDAFGRQSVALVARRPPWSGRWRCWSPSSPTYC
ncbi:MAG TPA: hypothetical protein VME67_22605 [Mycobacterium sp.]|nr:hypothetical protein [Mycobacterium sp.]HTX97382.1 hypothetical protein [Mycobacterium sp.]